MCPRTSVLPFASSIGDFTCVIRAQVIRAKDQAWLEELPETSSGDHNNLLLLPVSSPLRMHINVGRFEYFRRVKSLDSRRRLLVNKDFDRILVATVRSLESAQSGMFWRIYLLNLACFGV